MVLDSHRGMDACGNDYFGLSHLVAPQISLDPREEVSRRPTIDSRIVVVGIKGGIIRGVE